MPIHRNPTSRRDFVKVTAALGGVATILASTPAAFAAASQPTRIALLSDTHIPSSPDTAARGVNMTDNLRRTIADICKLKAPPSHLIINGDCAYLKGLPDDYANFAACLAPLDETQIALHVTMGNHDDRQSLYGALSNQRPADNPAVLSKHISVIETPHANFFLLDSLFRVNVVTGELGAEQIRWLAHELDTRQDKPAVVMTHHNPQFTAPTDGKQWTGISDTQELFQVLDARKHVRAFLYGHSHNWTYSSRGHFQLINLPPVAYVFSPDRPNGWVSAELTEDAMSLELHTFDSQHPQSGERLEVPLKA
ncbi:metallophosphoesterase family protein [Aureliella helgolandensis]|uniref:3',5'-cyclic adenosine monophosphate phosphodiesterase CpdA n=1 Tax=Aureliella helgolandensis TaxID=2527968 RepID=A0A518GDU9_9BACT|nr:metallophosphoesterase [Aureliella helgolandensis]QDV26774.1 3',5'-cyclic adenosine monophosphate phosphodiesterase CpdA [Aureliella helgolandensis]